MDKDSFRSAYAALNDEQRQAVDAIDGPVLVIAGPGTGKTQLLSARVANILERTDIPAQNILCLTFTESGARNMRERLARFIGLAAYDVQINTYHAFGGDIIQRFPQYFTAHRMQQAVDNLGRHQICASIVANMSYRNPLKQTQHHLGDLMSTISEIKRALLSPDDLRNIATENLQYIQMVNQTLPDVFAGVQRMPSKYGAALPYFSRTLETLVGAAPSAPVNSRYGSLAGIAIHELQQALEAAAETQKSTPLTTWKNNWLAKNKDNQLIFDGLLQNQRLTALADVVDSYETMLHAQGFYDFDDMIIRAVHAMESNDDLRFTLQETYQYILLDEFQDTNAAQLRLVELLTNNPLSEGRANVMAVGDDDQAIYAFQGAQYSNMLDFYRLYKDVKVVNLHNNYRSHPAILETATNITKQMDERLFTHFDGVEKKLTAANTKLGEPSVERLEFTSDVAERAHVALSIATLIDRGVSPRDIAVLAPKHRLLSALVPYLNDLNIPVHYEKRENILEAPLIRRLVTAAKLILALHQNDQVRANAYWPEVLSGEEWGLPVSDIWSVAWKVNDARGQLSWSQALLEATDGLKQAGLLYLGLAHRCDSETLEHMLDYLIGNAVLATNEPDYPQVTSPIRDYYLGSSATQDNPERFYETLSQLTVIRAKLRDFQNRQPDALTLNDFVALVAAYDEAGEEMLHTSPYQQSAEAVQLMTVYKAKGLEYEHVFILSCLDEIWGGSGSSNSNRITLPANLAPIRHSGATEDERLRLLFVAITRAKTGLHLFSHTTNYSGKALKRLRYLDEREQEDGSVATFVLPESFRTVVHKDESAPELRSLELNWQSNHTAAHTLSSLHTLLAQRIESYQLSPTHLNTFLDLEYGGPEKFFFNAILRFPSAPTIDSLYGDAIHESLEWFQHRLTETGMHPDIHAVIEYFVERLKHRKISEPQLGLEIERGSYALTQYLKQRGQSFNPTDRAEVNFRHEGVFVENAHLSGKIDRLEIDSENKTVTVVDFKTGKGSDSWKNQPKLLKHRRQLYCYKLLVEKSHTFAHYTVTGGRIEYIDPDPETGKIMSLELPYDDKELEETKELIAALWQHVQELNFPDVSQYDQTYKGIKQLESDLRNGSI